MLGKKTALKKHKVSTVSFRRHSMEMNSTINLHTDCFSFLGALQIEDPRSLEGALEESVKSIIIPGFLRFRSTQSSYFRMPTCTVMEPRPQVRDFQNGEVKFKVLEPGVPKSPSCQLAGEALRTNSCTCIKGILENGR
ncbi:uncharacterized protein LOC113327566 [Papaver somniferum]|uniref:uncharacterized protein LOC113327566 n=1 Tax=Papaver somniferum TaxID=3469 RepID=UPI000E6F6520|nr:uncharacterized protein LOC113327566 [Papaver somniferum]XP_026430527.1 uncharacterized protein LOC113327566 [Papaver somniferum]